MGSKTADLAKQGLISPPKWLPGNVCYETIVGSTAYGVSNDWSDADIYGFCIPPKEMVFPHLAGEILGFGRQKERFEQFQKHHIQDGEKGYDITIFSIVKYFHLCMENNPNMIDSLFTPANCVLHATKVGQMVRENRRIFLHKGCWHKFKGYAYSQLHKMTSKQPEGKRLAIVEQYGYDCYDEAQTEFLTNKGWKRFDEVTESDLLATVSPRTGILEFQKPIGRISKRYTGNLYEINSYLSRCVVTEGHNMLVSPAHRNPTTNYSYKYFPRTLHGAFMSLSLHRGLLPTVKSTKAEWLLIPLSDVVEGRVHRKRSWFHIRKGVVPTNNDYPVEDEYLLLAGMFVSEGTIHFRNSKVKNVAMTQTTNGRLPEFDEVICSIANKFPSHCYEYERETAWYFGRGVAEKLYNDFGHRSKTKRLPHWFLKLSHRQAMIFWRGLYLGDGSTTTAKNGSVVYTSSAQLAADVQAMMVCAGHLCSVRGPYNAETSYGPTTMFQIYRPDDQNPINCVSFKRIREPGDSRKKALGYAIQKHLVKDIRVVCFEVPNGTLVTRSNGKVAIQGNCKFAYHVVRLISEVEQILSEGDLDLQRNREELKSIRRGEWTAEQVKEHFARKETELEPLYHESQLPYSPDEERIKNLLLECLEEHYGSLDDCVVVPERAITYLREIQAIIEKATMAGLIS